MTKVLVTGFDLWGSVTVNPSWEIIKNLPTKAGEVDIVTRKINVVYSKIQSEMEAAISQVKPDLIVAFGLSESVPKPRVEAYGWNYGASGRDAAGVAKNGMLIATRDARVGFKTTFDYSHVEKWLVGSGFEAYHSDDAGDFLCNANIYYAMNALQNAGMQIPYMFVHVPSFATMGQGKQEEFARIIIQKALAEMNINIKLTDLKAGVDAGGSNSMSTHPENPEVNEPDIPDVKPSGSNEIEKNMITNASTSDYAKVCDYAVNTVTYRGDAMPRDRGKFLFKAKIDSNFEANLSVKVPNFISDSVPLKVGEHDYEILVWTELDDRSLERAGMSNTYTLEVKGGNMKYSDRIVIKGGSVEFGKLVDQAYTPK